MGPRAEAAGAAYVFEDVPGAIVCPVAPTAACAIVGKGSIHLK